MRSRNIKPGFLESDLLAECSFAARLLFVGLWMVADREGRMEDRPTRIKGQVFRFDNVDVAELLNELVSREFVLRYECDGRKYLCIPNFRKHQRPHRNEKKSEIPPYSGNGPNHSDQNRAQSALKEERGKRNDESGMMKEERGTQTDTSAGADGPSPELLEWIDWWNDLKQEGVVSAGVSRDPPSEAVLAGWKRVSKSKELQGLLRNRDQIEQEIRSSAFLGAGWFTLEKLLGGRNRDKAYFVQRILDGGYRDARQPEKKPQQMCAVPTDEELKNWNPYANG